MDVNLETHREGSPRTDTWTHAAEPGALDRLMQPQRTAPKVLITKGVEAKYLSAFGQDLLSNFVDLLIVRSGRRAGHSQES
jgi:hypothetical protein